jgi:hypothetical protein
MIETSIPRPQTRSRAVVAPPLLFASVERFDWRGDGEFTGVRTNCGLKTPVQIHNPQSDMKPFILIIEDDPDIAESIRYNLERDGSFVAEVALKRDRRGEN